MQVACALTCRNHSPPHHDDRFVGGCPGVSLNRPQWMRQRCRAHVHGAENRHYGAQPATSPLAQLTVVVAHHPALRRGGEAQQLQADAQHRVLRRIDTRL